MSKYYTSDTRDGAEVNNVGRDQFSLSTGDIVYHVTHHHNYYPIHVACNHRSMCDASSEESNHHPGSPTGCHQAAEAHILECGRAREHAGSAVSNLICNSLHKYSSLNSRHPKSSRVHHPHRVASLHCTPPHVAIIFQSCIMRWVISDTPDCMQL
ncbi:hypothetical protein FIBSPDRAFT_135489 [Athelia psychrophila]|uniref:Uncharacterized protein n=1 Tax=Athelia psychrophila TaxID=1759441 RepID=A0A166C6E7_9AGAM|nr:hypothetical protein FIBSPDRAFT_135489 [Fibularhizoctonia sp. CBS 109695]